MNLDAYLARIGLKDRPKADAAGLELIQRAQRMTIPFENLDIPLGRGISLDPDTVFEKLVTHRRGGYCFELNSLLCRALLALGFESRPLLARVWLFATDTVMPRTHTLNLVTLDDEEWVVDAGFSASMSPPLSLRDGSIVTGNDGVSHRLSIDAAFGWMVERDGGNGFKPLYSFTLDVAHPLDLEMSNLWTSTWKDSRFTQNVIANIVHTHGMVSLLNRSVTRLDEAGKSEREITSCHELQEQLSKNFGITLSRREVDALRLF